MAKGGGGGAGGSGGRSGGGGVSSGKLKAAGGSEWERGDKHRYYFNNQAELAGLTIRRSTSGAVRSALLDGSKISNSYAKTLLGQLPRSVHFDVKTQKLVMQGGTSETRSAISANLSNRLGRNLGG